MKDTTQLYIYPASYAREHGELEQYRASYKANIACKEAIEQAIADHYRDNHLGTEAVHQVLEEFGYDRMFYVLANTVRQKDWDGRISRDNKAWAKTIPVYENPDGFGQDPECLLCGGPQPPRTCRSLSYTGPARLYKETWEKSLDPRKYETEYRADGSLTYTNKTERAGTVKNFQIRTKQILSLLFCAVQKTIISKSAQNHCNFSCFAL